MTPIQDDEQTQPAGLRLGDVTRSYRGGPIIGPVSVSVPKGTVLGLVGGNGAGKSTLLRVICGLVAPDTGEVFVQGVPVAPGRPPNSLGAMIEEPALYSWASGRANLDLAAAARPDRAERIAHCLEQVGLTDAADVLVRKYSQGMRQRLGLARALLHQPSLLVLDEPTNGLDPQGIRWLRDLVREQAKGGTTVVVSSHLLGELRLMADQVLVLRDGKAVAQLDVDSLMRDTALEDYYFALMT